MRIRAAVASDTAALIRLDRVTSTPDVTPADPPGHPPQDALVAVADDAVAGYVSLGPATPLASNRHVLEITGLAVDPAHRREGIGRALVEAAVEEATRRGARRLRLRVLGPNQAARALYAACGFAVEGVLRGEFLRDGRYVDDVLMARELVAPASAAPAVLITGAPGAGKSTVLEALASVLEERGVSGFACFEREMLEWGEPWLDLEPALSVLAGLCRSLRAVGRESFVVTATTETEDELQATLAAIGARRSLVVALTVGGAVAADRVAAREPDWWDGKADLVAHARELAGVIPALAGVDVVVSNEGRDARATAVAIVDELAARGLTK